MKAMRMAEEFDLLEDVPAFPAYGLPPEAFPGFSAGSFGGRACGPEGMVANVEYLYRPDHGISGRMLGVSNTRPEDGNGFLREDPLWWASARVRIDEVVQGRFPLSSGVITGAGARFLGRGGSEIEGRRCEIQRWMTLPEHAPGDAKSVVRVRTDGSWVTLWSNSYTLEEVRTIVPRLVRRDRDLLGRLKLAFVVWMSKFEERRGDPGAD